MAPVPLIGQAGMEAQKMPLEVTKELMMEVVPLLMMGRLELLTMLVAPTLMGTT